MSSNPVQRLISHILDPDSSPGSQADTSSFYTAQESRVVFESIVEPVILRFKSDENSRRLAASSYYNLLFLRKSEKL